ncbi:hypothetical protein [Helicobacter pylori]|uniref:hypothetical protein n=1 Tax=Helicobacter pylori TaxID=210 RepID=UPI0015E74991|nr:hypothetical protein [Helicobacter pylori]
MYYYNLGSSPCQAYSLVGRVLFEFFGELIKDQIQDMLNDAVIIFLQQVANRVNKIKML